eukprot:TRINITY_DN5750_c0_g1_i1.p1 TRINITY_DN5750_c0_g1~~TRINITY_DN5750_c0_g1_i1.p1  ORF type:complete len:293 (+),score=68.90 TRINITY_DN5750_c0_g1_i1:78-956(+)
MWDTLYLDVKNHIFRKLFHLDDLTEKQLSNDGAEILSIKKEDIPIVVWESRSSWQNARLVCREWKQICDANFPFKSHNAIPLAVQKKSFYSLLLLCKHIAPSNYDELIFNELKSDPWNIQILRGVELWFVQQDRVNEEIKQNFLLECEREKQKRERLLKRDLILGILSFCAFFAPSIGIIISEIVILSRDYNKYCERPLQILLIVFIFLQLAIPISFLLALVKPSKPMLYYSVLALAVFSLTWSSVGATWISQSPVCKTTSPQLYKLSLAVVIISFTLTPLLCTVNCTRRNK